MFPHNLLSLFLHSRSDVYIYIIYKYFVYVLLVLVLLVCTSVCMHVVTENKHELEVWFIGGAWIVSGKKVAT